MWSSLQDLQALAGAVSVTDTVTVARAAVMSTSRRVTVEATASSLPNTRAYRSPPGRTRVARTYPSDNNGNAITAAVS